MPFRSNKGIDMNSHMMELDATNGLGDDMLNIQHRIKPYI
jgi:hypothetical protein